MRASDSASVDQPSLPWRSALRASLPVGMGYVPAGLAFGVLAVAAGLPVWVTVALSVVVYAGALQYAAIPLLAAGAAWPTLFLTALVINLRHVFYGLPLLPVLPRRGLARYYSLAALTDETYSLLTTLPLPSRAAWLLPLSVINQGWWVLGTLLGILVGPALGPYVPNLGFALPCLFLILAIEQYRSHGRLWPALLGVGAWVVARVLWPQGEVLLLAIGLSVLVLAGAARRRTGSAV